MTDERLLAIVGGDQRIVELLNVALTAYEWLPLGLFSFENGRPTRERVKEAIEAFGFKSCEIPWERFPKRFCKNKPQLVLFQPDTTPEQIEEYLEALIANNQDKPAAKPQRRVAKPAKAKDEMARRRKTAVGPPPYKRDPLSE